MTITLDHIYYRLRRDEQDVMALLRDEQDVMALLSYFNYAISCKVR